MSSAGRSRPAPGSTTPRCSSPAIGRAVPIRPSPRSRASTASPGTAFHSARWDHDHDLDGRRVGGDRHRRLVDPVRPQDPAPGAGAARVPAHAAVDPAARRGAHLTAAGRTASSAAPGCCTRRGEPSSTLLELRHRAFSHPHGRMAALNERMAVRHIERQVTDPDLRAKVTPTYRMGCKRILGSQHLVSGDHRRQRAARHERDREVGAGRDRRRRAALHHELDTIIFATGFRVVDSPIWSLVRRARRPLADRGLRGQPEGLHGHGRSPASRTCSAGRAGHRARAQSIVSMIEAQVGYFVRRSRSASDAGPGGDRGPRPEAQAAYMAELERRWRAACGRRAAVRAGTSTRQGATRRCGRRPCARISAGSAALSPLTMNSYCPSRRRPFG